MLHSRNRAHVPAKLANRPKPAYSSTMRLLKFSLILWVILAIPAYIWGLPLLVRYVEQKTKTEILQQCMAQMLAQKTDGLTDDDRQFYCHCLNEDIHLSKSDLFEMARTRTAPAKLRATLDGTATSCSAKLQQSIQFRQRPDTSSPLPAPRKLENGAIEMHL